MAKKEKRPEKMSVEELVAECNIPRHNLEMITAARAAYRVLVARVGEENIHQENGVVSLVESKPKN